MFDAARDSYPGQPPRSFLPRAALPVLRARGSEATVRGLAVLLVVETVEAARWIGLTWPGQDWTAPDHPSRFAGRRDPECPPGRAGATLALLADACMRHRAITGQDGIAVAAGAVRDYLGPANAALADDILHPLTDNWYELNIEAMLMPDPPASYPEPTGPELRAFEGGLWDQARTEPRLAGLAGALDAYMAAGGPEGDSEDARDALAVVEQQAKAAWQGGVDVGLLQAFLDIWKDATPDAPPIKLNRGRRSVADAPQPSAGSTSRVGPQHVTRSAATPLHTACFAARG